MKKPPAPPCRNGSSEYILTCIGHEITASFLEKVFQILWKQKIVIRKSKRLAQIKYDCLQISLSTKHPRNPFALTKIFSSISERYKVDMIVAPAELYFRKKRLVVMDLDSTLIAAEVIDELAKEAGAGEQVIKITQRAMNGEIPFPEALRERVRLLKGMRTAALEHVHKRIAYTSGAFEWTAALRKMGYKTAVLTGGFDFFAERVKKTLKIDYVYANRLEIKNNKVTGEVLGEIVDGKRKAVLLEEIAIKEGIPLDNVVAIGDGANDLPMITKAGLGIAFNAKPSVRKAAPYNITQKSLTTILHLFGFSEGEI
jgi:phosphoserine phosphatase